MPLVVVNTIPNVNDDELEKLCAALPKIVASALTCENSDGKLTPEDIEVWNRRHDRFDRGLKSLQIIVFANLYPERLADLDFRRREIERDIKELLPNLHGWVWILLQPASFGEF